MTRLFEDWIIPPLTLRVWFELGIFVHLLGLVGCQKNDRETSNLSQTGSPQNLTSTLPFREDFVPTLDWSCTMPGFHSIRKTRSDGSGSYETIYWWHNFSISWAGKLDAQGKPLNYYTIDYEAKIPNSMNYRGAKKIQTSIALQTQFAPDSTWPDTVHGPFIRTFRFVGTSKSDAAAADFQAQEVVYNGEASKDQENIAALRFVTFKLTMNKLLLPNPMAPESQSWSATCQVAKVHLRLGEPIQLVHSEDYGRPTLKDNSLRVIDKSHVDFIFNNGTVGSLGQSVKALKAAFDNTYVAKNYNKWREIAVINHLGIHIGNVVKSPTNSPSDRAPSGLLISNPFWAIGVYDMPSLILWDGEGVYRPRGHPPIIYNVYGSDEMRSKEFALFLKNLCQDVISPKNVCSKNDENTLLQRALSEVNNMTRRVWGCGR